MNLPLVALYVGPDQMMPVASILATVMGFAMIFWGKIIGIFRKIFGGSKNAVPNPHPATPTTKEPPEQH